MSTYTVRSRIGIMLGAHDIYLREKSPGPILQAQGGGMYPSECHGRKSLLSLQLHWKQHGPQGLASTSRYESLSFLPEQVSIKCIAGLGRGRKQAAVGRTERRTEGKRENH